MAMGRVALLQMSSLLFCTPVQSHRHVIPVTIRVIVDFREALLSEIEADYDR